MLLASPWSTLFHHALVVLKTLPRLSRGVGAGREAPRNGQSQLLSSGLFVSAVFPRLRAALLAVVSLSRDSSFGPHRREGDVEQKGTMLTLVCVIFFVLSFFKLERGDFLSEEWRERIANTRYRTAVNAAL